MVGRIVNIVFIKFFDKIVFNGGRGGLFVIKYRDVFIDYINI